MRIKSILISIVIAATAGMWCACNDDLDLGVNDAKLEKVEGFRISKFTTDRLNWAIDNGADIRIVFHSNADDALYEFSMTVDNSGSKPVYAIHIPEKQTIPDGEYDALAFLGNGKAICPRMKFKIIKEIVEEIQAREGKFRLPGHGTQEKPYIIGSKEAFNEFEIGLCEDGNSKGFGLFFEQTASFDVPPRSQIITGTYHACESFAGNYQGNGFTLTVPYTGSTSEPNDCEIGLFKELVGGAVIHNLTINAMIQGVHSNGGALAGKSSGKVMIDSVNIEGSINAQNRYNIGGIIGLADNIDKGYVRGCVNNSPKIDNKISDSTGGIIGRLNQFDCATCENLINYGEISGANYTGGIIGDIHEEGKAKNFYLKNAVNVGKVTGTGQVGGCVGHYWASGILNLGIETIHYILYCANYGEVNGSNGGNVGGIIGYFNARKAVVSHSANHGKVYGSGNDVKVGGIAGRMGSNDEAGTALPNNMELSYSCNFGEVGSNTGNANVGGLLGWQEQGSPDDETHYMLHNCYNMGIVPTNQDSDNGGVLGCIDHLGEVQNCYNAKKVSHGNGIIGTHKGGSIFYHHNLYVLEDSGKYWCADKFKESDKSKESTYKGFDFKSVWAVSTSTNNGFPYLRDCPYQFKKLE